MALKLVRNSCLDRQVSVLLEVDVSTFSDFAAPLRWIVSLWTEDKGGLRVLPEYLDVICCLKRSHPVLTLTIECFPNPYPFRIFLSQTWFKAGSSTTSEEEYMPTSRTRTLHTTIPHETHTPPHPPPPTLPSPNLTTPSTTPVPGTPTLSTYLSSQAHSTPPHPPPAAPPRNRSPPTRTWNAGRRRRCPARIRRGCCRAVRSGSRSVWIIVRS